VSAPRGIVDAPADGALVQRHAFVCEGWVLARGEHRVEAYVDGALAGRTSLAYARPDVEAALDLGGLDARGFTISCLPPDAVRERPETELVVLLHDDDGTWEIGRRRLRFSAIDYRAYGHGTVLSETHPGVMRRHDVYGSGPPSALADPRAVELLARWLRPGERILDVGCGIGAYGRVLRELGYDWTGVEVRAEFVEAMRARGLNAVVSEGARLPFEDRAFDAALCIEVLEHIEDFGPFLAEVARVTRRIAFFSVPNYEAVPVMARAYAIPWHMLEADHKNFFTRRGLARTLRGAFREAEVIEYGPIETFPTPDGNPVFNHLFGIARV
jgi:2-polyprenyl-3-methyl-5-hydroxy-6-metoxy-1,4-benzoquinol methylase